VEGLGMSGLHDVLAEAFAQRSVFITGHTGFKGSWLALWLSRLGARVTGYALNPPTVPSAFEAAGVRDVLAAHREADIRDGVALTKAMRDSAPDVVFHLAAQALVLESYAQPRETFDVNVIGTVGVLQAVRELKRPCVVIVVTSDKCYDNREQVWGYREIDPLGGSDPYSASKGAAEMVVASYRHSFFPPERLSDHGVKIASVRAGNVIGGGDWSKDRIIADMARSLSSALPVQVRNPGSLRPWQHVLEPLSGFMSLAARMLSSPDGSRYAGAWNFGPSAVEVVTVAELVDLFIDAWGSGTRVDASRPNQPKEARVLRLSIDKATSELGWRPRWSAREAVVRASGWYRRYYECAGHPDAQAVMRSACLADISDYEAGSVAVRG
jgi:CDP-glucose 4,6-dehydratase